MFCATFIFQTRSNAPIDKTEPKIKFPEILNLFFKLILLQKLVKYSATELAEILA